MTVHQEWMELREIAKATEEATCGLQQLRKVKQAKWAVDEIRRLRAKVNRLIRGYQYFDLHPKTEDLIREEEI
jgi:hypothetical protein